MRTAILEFRRTRLAWKLGRLSAAAWVREVDHLADYPSITLEEAVTLLGRRFSGEYLDSRRQIAWSMLEYVFMRFEPHYWDNPMKNPFRRQRKGAAA